MVESGRGLPARCGNAGKRCRVWDGEVAEIEPDAPVRPVARNEPIEQEIHELIIEKDDYSQ